MINAVAGLHENHNESIRTLIFSRDELDIRQRFTKMQFEIFSIAATSADLRLFANAWLPELDVQSEALKAEIVDTLIENANGM